MPRVAINGASIFYRSFGEPGPTPIVLVHGALVDGVTDWAPLAPVLGIRHHVIVPDCRGHGRSTNPSGGYSFAQMAADVAALVRALGHEQAHLVGHSNGANVALVTANDHPDVVATCVVQAGNAFVPDALRDRIRTSLDPDRVARREPGLLEQMSRIHGRQHGRDYWRELLSATARETAVAPAYRAVDLAGVCCPVLAIEGRDDRLNAEFGCASFIAGHIPDAELWQPDGAGHAVHLDRPIEWLTCVTDFWARRGTPASDRLWRLRNGALRDERTAVLEVTGAPGGSGRLRAIVLDDNAAALVRGTTPGDQERVSVHVLRSGARPAIVTTGVADVRRRPALSSERVTQALFGEQVERLETRDGFARVQLARDGYLGWLAEAGLGTPRGGCTASHRVWADSALLCATPDGPTVGRLPFGARTCVRDIEGDWLAVDGPDGILGWVRRGDVRPLRDPCSMEDAIERFRGFVGVPYLWGGRTPWGFDCSGLTQAFYDALGVGIARDVDQQWNAGAPGGPATIAGSLVFFRDPLRADGPVTHVGIGMGHEQVLHAWGEAGRVEVSDLDPARPGFVPSLARRVLGTRRFSGAADADR